MSLKNKKSLYDTVGGLGVTGRTVNETDPKTHLEYYRGSDGDTPNAPFQAGGNSSEDHLVELLNSRISSANTNQTYPNHAYFRPPSKDLDLEITEDSIGNATLFHGMNRPGKGDGKKLGKQDLHVAMLQEQYQRPDLKLAVGPGGLDLNTSNKGIGDATLFHGVNPPTVYEGKQYQGVDLHEALLTAEYTYGNPATTVPIPPSTSKLGYIDLDGVTPNGYTSNESLLDDNARF